MRIPDQREATMATKRKSPRPEIPADQRYGSDTDLSRRLGITTMTLWRWRQDQELNFPKPTRIRGRTRNDFEIIDAFMAKLAKKQVAA